MWRPESVYDASGHLDEGVVHGWLDGALAEESAREVESHAASCGECAARVAEARGLIAGAGRVLGALDAGVSGVGNPEAAPPVRPVAIGDRGGSGAIGTRPPAPEVSAGRGSPRRRWTTRRISLAAAAALVFVAGTVVLRDELGGGRGVREAIVGDRGEEMVSATSGESLAAPEASLDAAGGGVGSDREASAAEAAPLPSPDRFAAATPQRAPAPEAVSGRIGGRAVPPAPPAMAPSPFPMSEASPVATRAADRPAAIPAPPPSAAPAPSAQVGNVAADAAAASDAAAAAAAARTEQRAAARRLGAAASAPPAPEAAKSADRPAAESVVATAAPGERRGAQAARSAMAPQRIDDSLYSVTPPWRSTDAWMMGCWRVEGSETMLLFDREELMARAYTPTGDWHAAIRIAGDIRSVAEWRPDGDSTAAVRVRAWDSSSDLLVWRGRDTLEAALVPRADSPPSALTEQPRIDREARRLLRSEAYERRLTLVRLDAGRCAP